MSSRSDSAPVLVAKGAAFIFAGLIFARLLNYAYRIVLARAGGIEQFGLLFLGVSTIAVVGGLAVVGLDMGVARFIPLYLGQEDRPRLRGMLRYALAASLFTGVAAGAALYLAGPWIAVNLLRNEPLVDVFHICALCLPFYVSDRVLIKTVVAFQKIGYRVAVNQILNPLVRLLLTLALLAAGMGVLGAMWAYLASELLSFAALLWLVEKRIFPVFSTPGEEIENLFEARAFFAYSLPLFLAGIIDLVLNYTDAFMTDYFLDASQVGIYGAAATLTSLAALGTELLNPMFLSIITQDYARRNLPGVVSTFNNNNRWFSYITLPIVALLVILPSETIVLIWGNSFEAGWASLVILTLGRAVFYLATTSGFVLSMHGATRYILIANLISALLNVVLNYSLIPLLGITGAALGTAISLTVQSVLFISAARLHHRGQGMRVLYPGILAAAALPAVLCLTVKSYFSSGWVMVIGLGLGYSVIYLALLKVFNVFSAEDYQIWRAILSRIKARKA
ncbi:MAG TPA: flippase [archaeon]|nr:flippase [archaeon]